MSDFGKQFRLNRLLRGNKKKTLVVAFDHPVIFGPIAGTENPAEQIGIIANHGADAMLLNLGMLRIAGAGMMTECAPALIVRLDWTTAWTAVSSGAALRSELVVKPAEALRYGADAVMTYLFVGTGDNDFEAREIKRNAEVARECEQLGIPLIVETLARGKSLENPTSPEWIKIHTRIALELGADVLKTDYTGDVETMRDVIQTCPAPILVLGGAQKPESEVMDIVKGVVAAGAAGLVFGRNVFQAHDVAASLRRLRTALDEPSS